MHAVLLFSHGSLLCGSGQALDAHAARLRERGIAPIVAVGYLNYSEPAFADSVARCVEAGATHILVVPYFLVPGKFVRVDLPEAVEKARQAYPDLTFTVAEAIGFDVRLADTLIESAQSAVPPALWREDLQRAVRFCRNNPDCPLYPTPACPHLSAERGRASVGAASADFQFAPVAPTATDAEPSALLVMVHGSPRPVANTDMFRVVEVVREKCVFPVVEVGFMECNAPTIPDAIDACVAQGAIRILAVPYFLHTGTHVTDDLPTLLEEGAIRHPHVAFRMGGYLGRSERLTDILAARIASASAVE